MLKYVPMLVIIIAAAVVAGLVYNHESPTECTPGDPFMVIHETHVPAHFDEDLGQVPEKCLRGPVVLTCGDTSASPWVIHDETREIPCPEDLPEGETRRVPVESVYPNSIVGFVGRHPVTYDEGTELEFTDPGWDPKWHVCQGPGCYCAGTPDQCENIPVGGPDGYWCIRLKRLNPNVNCP